MTEKKAVVKRTWKEGCDQCDFYQSWRETHCGCCKQANDRASEEELKIQWFPKVCPKCKKGTFCNCRAGQCSNCGALND